MSWSDDEIPISENGRPMFKGCISLTNDRGEQLASIVWFRDKGPFYAHAMDPTDPAIIRRIGPVTTLDGAKLRCVDALEGRVPDLGKRAGYPR
jgi:hypothetical protein